MDHLSALPQGILACDNSLQVLSGSSPHQVTAPASQLLEKRII